MWKGPYTPFDLVKNDPYRRHSRRSAGAVGRHGGEDVACGRPARVADGVLG